MRVFAPPSFRTASFVPTAVNRPLLTATACAVGDAGFTVTKCPLKKIVSGGFGICRGGEMTRKAKTIHSRFMYVAQAPTAHKIISQRISGCYPTAAGRQACSRGREA